MFAFPDSNSRARQTLIAAVARPGHARCVARWRLRVAPPGRFRAGTPRRSADGASGSGAAGVGWGSGDGSLDGRRAGTSDGRAAVQGTRVSSVHLVLAVWAARAMT